MNRARRIAALRAMAEQESSPEEAAIAREKLAALESREASAAEVLTWQQRQALEAERQRLADEAVYAELVKRWERGTFTGATVKAGATTKVTYRRKLSEDSPTGPGS